MPRHIRYDAWNGADGTLRRVSADVAVWTSPWTSPASTSPSWSPRGRRPGGGHRHLAPTERSVRRTYARAALERAWLDGSGGLVYVIHDDRHALPSGSRGAW